jgi:hypothetical protein
MAEAPVSLEVMGIQRAMAELFEAIEADAARRPLGEIALEGVIYAAARSHREDDVARIIRDPVAMACQIALRILGKRLFELIGSHERMIDVAERAADGANKLRRRAVVAVAWRPIFEATESISVEDLSAENDE